MSDKRPPNVRYANPCMTCAYADSQPLVGSSCVYCEKHEQYLSCFLTCDDWMSTRDWTVELEESRLRRKMDALERRKAQIARGGR